MLWPFPVSYTHLDVYKRQVQTGFRPSGWPGNPGLAEQGGYDGGFPIGIRRYGCLLYTSRCV